MAIRSENGHLTAQASEMYDSFREAIMPIYDKCKAEGISNEEIFYLVSGVIHEIYLLSV